MELQLNATYTDFYEITMGQAYFLSGDHEKPACFDYFFRKSPFNGGYVVFAGLGPLLEILENFTFSRDDLEKLKAYKLDPKYLHYLENFSFKGSIHSVREGEPVFPEEPVIRVEANVIEAQLIESLLLNYINYQSLVATKAYRIRMVAGDAVLSDFGLRRAQGTGANLAARSAVIGGFDSTSNTMAALGFDLQASGTMAHSFVQSQEDELTAFRKYANAHPDSSVLLVDTYDSLRSGIPNAIRVARELREEGHELKAIRLDSGDLAYQAKKARKMLDEAGFPEVRIAASNQLDEHLIYSLRRQNAPIDLFGVGTSLVTGSPDGALDGVYKLSSFDGKPRLKLSENRAKMTLPGIKKVARLLDEDGSFFGADLVMLEEEKDPGRMIHPSHPDKSMETGKLEKEEVLSTVMKRGLRSESGTSPAEISRYCKERMSLLPDEYKRFENPHVYKIGISESLHSLREKLRQKYSQT